MRAFGSRGTEQEKETDFDLLSKKGPVKSKTAKVMNKPVGKASGKTAKKSRPLTYFGQHTA